MSANKLIRQPLALALADRFRRGIAEGRYPQGLKLPPEPELALETGVSRATLREALRLLEREGLVVRRQRAGTFVSSRPVVRNSLERNFGVREVIESSGRAYGIKEAQIRFVAADAVVAEALGLAEGAPMTVLERTRTSDGRAIALTFDYLDSDLVENATAPLVQDVSLYTWLRHHCDVPVAYGVARIEAMVAGDAISAQLESDPSAIVFRLSQTDYTSEGRAVLYSVEMHLADTLELRVVRTGPHN